MKNETNLNLVLPSLAEQAWEARQNAYVIGETRVGAAVLGSDGQVYLGCNVEHRYRCHDVHAEVNAITSMVTAGTKKVVAVFVVAERERFTPCGGCLDWIFQFGGENCVVAYQSKRGGQIKSFTAADLMPHYPR